MADKDKEIPGRSSGGWKCPRAKDSTELLFENHAGFTYASDDGSESETEPENASLTPSLSLARLSLTPTRPSSSSYAPPLTSTLSTTNPLGQIRGQTVLAAPAPPGSSNSSVPAESSPRMNNNGHGTPGGQRLLSPSLGKLKNKKPPPPRRP